MDLNPGEVKCNECAGRGNFGYDIEIQEIQIRGMVHRVPGLQTPKTCSKCKGEGKLDWIENIVGKRPMSDPWYAPAGFRRGKINAIKTR